jgi:hypothetical protein
MAWQVGGRQLANTAASHAPAQGCGTWLLLWWGQLLQAVTWVGADAGHACHRTPTLPLPAPGAGFDMGQDQSMNFDCA